MPPTNLTTATADEVGRALSGFGVNLLVRQIAASCEFLQRVFDFSVVRADQNYALLTHRGQYYQLHTDATYAAHPLYELLPPPPRGLGVELRLYEVDPEQAESRARECGFTVLQSTADKPHGLRECFILDADGYCWVPSVRLPADA